MSSARQLLDAAVQSELRGRVATLRGMSPAELASLPASATEESVVLGKPVDFTVHRELNADGRLLVLVRSDRRMLFGMGSTGTTEGFWVEPSGQRPDALMEEIMEFFS